MILLSTIYTDYTTSDLWQQLELAFKLESDLKNTVKWGRMWLVDFNTEKLNSFHLTGLITLVVLM